MRRKLLCGLAALGFACPLAAQPVPARDLWEFPLGAMLEPAALAFEPGAGLWNPASIALRPRERWRLGLAALGSGADQEVGGQLLSAALRRASGVTLGVSIARSAIASIPRTDSDPQTLDEVPYATTLVSVGAARELVPHLTGGFAVRLRDGRADRDVGQAVAADLGVVAHGLTRADARIALSSFLWRPGREIEDRPALVAAADARVVGSGTRELRLGYSHNGVNRGAQERGPFAGARLDRIEARLAYLRTAASGSVVSRSRFGVAFHSARFVVGVAREEGASGLGALWQFTLSTTRRE
jgi:hypothetical protein